MKVVFTRRNFRRQSVLLITANWCSQNLSCSWREVTEKWIWNQPSWRQLRVWKPQLQCRVISFLILLTEAKARMRKVNFSTVLYGCKRVRACLNFCCWEGKKVSFVALPLLFSRPTWNITVMLLVTVLRGSVSLLFFRECKLQLNWWTS